LCFLAVEFKQYQTLRDNYINNLQLANWRLFMYVTGEDDMWVCVCISTQYSANRNTIFHCLIWALQNERLTITLHKSPS
jgi:hypothetical protein